MEIELRSERFVVDGRPLASLREIHRLPEEAQRAIYRTLIPDFLLERYGINPVTLCDSAGQPLVRIRGESADVEIEVWRQAEDRDPLVYLHFAETLHNCIIVLLFMTNDPESPRFDVDRDWEGRPTKYGTVSRNVEAEIAAMRFGLAPGQMRRGLRLTKHVLPLFEQFIRRLGHDLFLVEPLAYHVAVLFERHGCGYIEGRTKMEWIHREFQPGGVLHRRLDGSTPFRQPGMERTVRGRSWAIYDGILEEPFDGVRMYKRVGHHAGICTFPDAIW
ncbi:MAG: hypothetical protein J7452_13955 [Thermoflexus sp.]|jgi:hypothetical protein|nr:hypothetical protein [Thermoflexus sp.]